MAVKSILGQLLFEKKPDLPALEAIDLGDEQQKAIKGNQAALPGLEALASSTNEFQRNERLKALREIYPTLDTDIAQLEKNLGSSLKGEIPEDLANRIQDTTAAKALGGTGASLYETGYGQNELRRLLGLTSYGIKQQAQSNFDSWLRSGATMLAGPQLDFTNFFVSPMQQANFDVSERNTMWNYNWFKNQLDAQPKPWQKAVEGLLDWVANTGLSAATMGIGGMGGAGDGTGDPSGNEGMPPGLEDAVGGSGEISSGFRIPGIFGKTQGGPWYIGSRPGPG